MKKAKLHPDGAGPGGPGPGGGAGLRRGSAPGGPVDGSPMAPRCQSPADWFAARRNALSRGGLWLEGDEPGRPDPRDFESARLRLLICRLSPHDDVLASITHRVLLRAALAVPGVFADLAYFPSESDAASMRKDGVPLWLATGSKRAPADFDVVAVSLSVQQEALHLPAALQESGLRLDFAGRMAEARHPWILLGGQGAGSVPFAHGDANGPGSGGLVDAVCLGDGISWMQEFLRRWLEAGKAGTAKRDFLDSLARELPGTYAPALYRHAIQDRTLTAIEPRLPGIPMPAVFRQDPMEIWLKEYDGAYIPFSEEEAEETLPLAAGCAYRCRFCQTGWMRGGSSVATRDALLEAAARVKAAMVNSDLNLLASDACSVADLEPILSDLGPLFRRVSVKSLSVASLARRPDHLRLLGKLAKHEFTFGVEGISARLRAYLGKPATAPDLIRIAQGLSGGGLRQMKLFFIVTGLEEEPDLEELGLLLKSIRSAVPACRVIASFMPLFHAPFTPLQFAPLRPVTQDLEKALSACVRHGGAEFRWSAFPDEIALMSRLCRAGRTATPALIRFSLRRGLRYTRKLDPELIRELSRALPDDDGEKDLHSVFPWSDLQASADAETLWASYGKALRELQAIPDAGRAAQAAPRRSLPAPDIPAPAVEPIRLSFWIWLQPEQARHPDHVIVRSHFRHLFTGWKDGMAGYWGVPRLLRAPGASGLALASAEFKSGTRPPPDRLGADAADPSDIREEGALFGIRWTSAEPAQLLLKSLHQGRVKFQTVRHGSSRWHIVERAFRGRTGLTALREDGERTELFVQRQPSLPGIDAAFRSVPAGVAHCLLAKAEAACPVCKGTRFTALKAVGPEPPPPCFDCLTNPGRNLPAT